MTAIKQGVNDYVKNVRAKTSMNLFKYNLPKKFNPTVHTFDKFEEKYNLNTVGFSDFDLKAILSIFETFLANVVYANGLPEYITIINLMDGDEVPIYEDCSFVNYQSFINQFDYETYI